MKTSFKYVIIRSFVEKVNTAAPPVMFLCIPEAEFSESKNKYLK